MPETDNIRHNRPYLIRILTLISKQTASCKPKVAYQFAYTCVESLIYLLSRSYILIYYLFYKHNLSLKLNTIF